MKLFLKFDVKQLCDNILSNQFSNLNINFRILAYGEIEILDKLSKTQWIDVKNTLEDYGITVVEDQKSILIQKIKDAIIEMVNDEEETITVKSSVYLAEKLNHSYGYLSNLFSEITYTSIENYIILQKIEHAKHLITTSSMTLTEIAFKLNYSSVAHLSTQFKNTTGITPSAFQRIIVKRREITL
ncbi:helix-turn-helix domain-containing protein [Psychroserpens luteus]|jgi:AraC-like DNA-binding protein|uniref:Helix-turn-helix domain-containing protein n=1 Tax=Psychroserpens luteus TaxID=1434066 RepID=A0ABW5ZPU9_9FLAO|nr:AraC family transcriptional regulator [Psychroserpens luteus]